MLEKRQRQRRLIFGTILLRIAGALAAQVYTLLLKLTNLNDRKTYSVLFTSEIRERIHREDLRLANTYRWRDIARLTVPPLAEVARA